MLRSGNLPDGHVNPCGAENANKTLFFSQILEPNRWYNQWWQIFNPTDETIELNDYAIAWCREGCIGTDGVTFDGIFSFPTNHTIAPYTTYSACHQDTKATGGCDFKFDRKHVWKKNGVYALIQGASDVETATETHIVDLIGNFSSDNPGAGWRVCSGCSNVVLIDALLVRAQDVCCGNGPSSPFYNREFSPLGRLGDPAPIKLDFPQPYYELDSACSWQYAIRDRYSLQDGVDLPRFHRDRRQSDGWGTPAEWAPAYLTRDNTDQCNAFAGGTIDGGTCGSCPQGRSAFISQFQEGTRHQDRYFQIFNPRSSSMDLQDFWIGWCESGCDANGAFDGGFRLATSSSSLASGGSYTVCHHEMGVNDGGDTTCCDLMLEPRTLKIDRSTTAYALIRSPSANPLSDITVSGAAIIDLLGSVSSDTDSYGNDLTNHGDFNICPLVHDANLHPNITASDMLLFRRDNTCCGNYGAAEGEWYSNPIPPKIRYPLYKDTYGLQNPEVTTPGFEQINGAWVASGCSWWKTDTDLASSLTSPTDLQIDEAWSTPQEWPGTPDDGVHSCRLSTPNQDYPNPCDAQPGIVDQGMTVTEVHPLDGAAWKPGLLVPASSS
jgi:hypothetical protein